MVRLAPGLHNRQVISDSQRLTSPRVPARMRSIAGGSLPAAGSKPLAVLFVDDDPWDCFIRLAALLRRVGIRTIRCTSVEPRRVLTAFGLVYDHTISRTAQNWESQLAAVLSRYELADVQCIETSAAQAYSIAAATDSPHAARWCSRAAMVDKFDLAQTLRAGNVPVPDTMSADEATPSDAVAWLGLPLVCKPRIGSGGWGVHIVGDLNGVEQIAQQDRDSPRFYERHVVGEPLRYGALVTEDGIVAAACYRSARGTSPTGPSAFVESLHVPEFDEVAAALVAATGVRGLLNLNAIRDRDGALWVHDVNPRAWGSLGATTSMGVDLSTAYVRWLQGLPVPVGHSREGGGPVAVFPGAARQVGPGFPSGREFAAWLWRERRICGARFSLVEAVRHRGALRPHRRTDSLAGPDTSTAPLDHVALTAGVDVESPIEGRSDPLVTTGPAFGS